MTNRDTRGQPRITRATIAAAPGTTVTVTGCKYIQVSNESAAAVRIYANAADMVANVSYIELAASTGYFEGPWAQNTIYMASQGGSVTVPMIYYV